MSKFIGTMYFLPILLVYGFTAATDIPHLLSDVYIDLINSQQSLWKAGRNFPADMPLEHLTPLFGAFLGKLPEDHSIKTQVTQLRVLLPENFDSREKWQNCPSLKEIRDQGSCGSCWAFAAVGAMTDRWCIHSNGEQFHFSAQDMTGCAPSHVCHGGIPYNAWNFWNKSGVVSGGNYNSKQGCKPYEIPTCIHSNSGNGNCSNDNVVDCLKTCRKGYDVPYKQDKRFGSKPYVVVGEENIKAELYTNGPLEVAFTACPDLFHYESGVYKSTIDPKDRRCGGHAVKLLGWGVENGTKYWLLANSWNTYWGDLGGVFKFLRGENHMGIESEVVGGMPNYRK